MRPRLTFANVVSCVALFVALGGTAYAVGALPRNSVGTAQLRNGAVTGSKVRDGSLSLADLGGALPRGPIGPQGPPGPAGPVGAAGPNGPSDAYAAHPSGQHNLSTRANVPTPVVSLQGLPAGQYVLIATSDMANNNAGAEIFCAIVVNGTQVAGTGAHVGSSAGFAVVANIDAAGGVSEPATFDASYECSSDTAYSSPPFTDTPSLVAIRVTSLHPQ